MVLPRPLALVLAGLFGLFLALPHTAGADTEIQLTDTPSRTLVVPDFDPHRAQDLMAARLALETLVLDLSDRVYNNGEQGSQSLGNEISRLNCCRTGFKDLTLCNKRPPDVKERWVLQSNI